jgi:putative transposase
MACRRAPEKPQTATKAPGTPLACRCLILLDDFTRQCLAIQVDTSIGGSAVADLLASLVAECGQPIIITTDRGPEFTCRALHRWIQTSGVTLNHIQPGKPTQNAFIESSAAPAGAALRTACGRLSRSARINGTFRDDCLNQHWFSSLPEARLLIEHWRKQYNQLRPHSSIGRIPPNSFALMFPPNSSARNITIAIHATTGGQPFIG